MGAFPWTPGPGQSRAWTVLSALLFVACSCHSACAQTSYTLLSTERANLVFLPYNLTEKQFVLQQVFNLFAVWANYRFKQNYYNDVRVDPFPRLAALASQLANMTTDEFNFALISIFNNVRDGHTNYITTGPYSCYAAAIGILFTFAKSSGDIATDPKVVVEYVSVRPQVLALIGAELSQVSVGDELIAVDGLSFIDYVNAHVYDSFGANVFGGMRTVLNYILSYRFGALNKLPESDSIVLTLRSAATQILYSITVPYVAVRDDACWNVTSAVYENVTGVPVGGVSGSAPSLPKRLVDYTPAQVRPKLDPRKTPLGKRVFEILDKEQEPLKAAAPGAPLLYDNTVPMYGTDSPSIFWGIFQPGGKNLGIILLVDLEVDATFGALVMRGLLVRELKDTNAVVIDLRGNGGGNLLFSNIIPQLFKSDFVEAGAKFIHNDIGRRIFVDNSGPGESFYEAYISSAPHAYFTNLGYFGTFESDNSYGQAYFKPFGIFTDASCFSACDLFSANVANSATGIVFGEDGQTGGGGANVFETGDLVSLDPTDFQLLPYTLNLGAYKGYMRVGIRAIIQNGLNNGVPLEDNGAHSDYVVRPLISDLLPSATTSSQFARIADILRRSGDAAGTNGLYFILEPLVITLRQAPYVSLTAEVANLDNLHVFSTAGVPLGRRLFLKLGFKRNVTVRVKAPSSNLGNAAIFVQSFASITTSRRTIVKTRRILSLIPPVAKYFSLSGHMFVWDLTLQPFVGVYNNGASLDDPTLGWVPLNGKWVIGDGVQYANNVDTALQFFFQAAVGTNVTVSLKASYDTEYTYDYFYVLYVDDNNLIPLLASSGQGTIDTSLSILTKATYFSISLRFISDPAVQFSGVFLSSFSVM